MKGYRTNRRTDLDATALRLDIAGGVAAGPTSMTAAEWWSILRRLPAVEGRVVVMRVMHGLTDEEIGERLGVSSSRVGQHWHRAVRGLAKSPHADRLLESLT